MNLIAKNHKYKVKGKTINNKRVKYMKTLEVDYTL